MPVLWLHSGAQELGYGRGRRWYQVVFKLQDAVFLEGIMMEEIKYVS